MQWYNIYSNLWEVEDSIVIPRKLMPKGTGEKSIEILKWNSKKYSINPKVDMKEETEKQKTNWNNRK